MSDDPQLKSLLDEWTAPTVPASLAVRLDRARSPRWRRALAASIPIPVPVALALTMVLAYGTWRVSTYPVTCASPVATAQRNCLNASEC